MPWLYLPDVLESGFLFGTKPVELGKQMREGLGIRHCTPDEVVKNTKLNKKV